jgi:adenine-specific DNA-methyltransferase
MFVPMDAPTQAIDFLVDSTLAGVADRRDPELVREAFLEVLAELTVPSDDQAAWTDGADVFGNAYERLVGGEHRRKAGQFFTPFWAGEVMARWLLSEPTKLMLDPGCGSGALLIPAARRPERKGARLLGIDRDPLAIQMARTNARLRQMAECEFVVSDFMLEELEAQPGAISCNPPYSRHHDISPREKAAIHAGFEKRLGLRLSRLAALHVLFLVRALEVCEEGGRVAFITPSDWLDVGYGNAVKRHLLDHAHVEALIFLDSKELFFDGVLTTAAISLIRKSPEPGAETRILRLGKSLPTPEAVVDAVRGGDLDGSEVSTAILDDGTKWSRYTSATRTRSTRQATKLGDVARIRRGIATGCNRFFVISERRRRERGIPPTHVRPCITSPRAFAGEVLSSEVLEGFTDNQPRWALECRNAREERADTPVGRYLRWGRRTLKAHKGYLVERRKPWYALERRGESPILFTYFNRDRPRFVRNTAGAVPLNNWLIIEPAQGIDPDALFEALSHPSVRRQLEHGARVYGGGLWKLEPAELSEITLPHDLRRRSRAGCSN